MIAELILNLSKVIIAERAGNQVNDPAIVPKNLCGIKHGLGGMSI